MTFTIRTRGAPASLIAVEFDCAECGIRYEHILSRDPSAPDAIHRESCPECGYRNDAIVSAPAVRVKLTEAVSRGRSDERPPGMLDTRPLAEGMPLSEWRAKQDRISDELRRKKIKAMVS